MRIRTYLSVFVGRSSAKVLASMAATLVGFAMFAVLPPAPGAPDFRSAVELTSGGKFAARIPGAADEQERSIEARSAVAPSETAGARHAALDFALLPPTETDTIAAATPGDTAGDRPSRGRVRPVRPASSRHTADAMPLPLARPTTLPAAEASAAAPGDGVIPKLMSSARSLWSFSASAGAALLSRVVP